MHYHLKIWYSFRSFMKFPQKMFTEIKTIKNLLDNRNIILLNNKFNGEKVGTINNKKN